MVVVVRHALMNVLIHCLRLWARAFVFTEEGKQK